MVMRKRWLPLLAIAFAILHFMALTAASNVRNSQWTEEEQRHPTPAKYELAGRVADVLLFPGSMAGGCLMAFPVLFLLNSLLWGVALALLARLLLMMIQKR